MNISSLTTEEILTRGMFSLIYMAPVNGLPFKNDYPDWIATSWTPRRETASGDTPREALLALLEKLDMT